jgi:hypothetical protein
LFGASGLTSFTATVRNYTRTWFSAGYRYWIKDTSSWLWRGKATAILFGAFPTPELVYAVTPWTWLTDWFTDLGDIFALYSPTAVDNLVTRYAFAMRTTRITEERCAHTEVSPANSASRKWTGGRATLRSLYQIETKQRGFGMFPFGTSNLQTQSLTKRQTAILTALATSRVTR